MYTIYKTTNLVNDKIYIGYHKTNNLNDPYLGSGKILLKAIEKYGKENFKKEILFIFDNQKDAFKKENELVDETFVNDKNTYNIKLGGEGGWDYINYKLQNDPEYKKQLSISISKASIKGHREGKLKSLGQTSSDYKNDPNKIHWNKDKPKSIETKNKMSRAKLGKSILNIEVINSRLQDIKNTPRDKMFRKVLMKKWNITPQAVGRFLKKYNEC